MADLSTIQVTPELLRGEAKKIRAIRDNHDTEMKNLAKLISSLENIWKGKSQNAYYNKFEEAQGTFRNFSEMLQEFAQLMEYSASSMEAKDEELAQNVSKTTLSFK